MQLVILAAGMGSRFGGLKQIEPIDEYKNFIIDYSIYDAIEAGFEEIVFIIKKENYEIFRDTIGKRIEGKAKVKYAFQEVIDIPIKLKETNRIKPWGTAHALYSARNCITDNFVIINADDYYGKDAYNVAFKFLKSLDNNSKNLYANISFSVDNTLTENGAVKRGVCYYDDNFMLCDLIESSIEKIDNIIVASPINKELPAFPIKKDQMVSMNMFAFSKDFIDVIKDNLTEFLARENLDAEKDEYLVPVLIGELVKQNKVSVKIMPTTSIWYGVTYYEDKNKVVEALRKMVDNNLYKKGLW